MQSTATNVLSYLQELPNERKLPMETLHNTIIKNLPQGFETQITYGMIGYVVPHSIYPNGYHCNPTLPLGFMNIASQKNFIALYHMGLYANEPLMQWFVTAYTKQSTTKLDMGKSCIRFKKTDQIPYDLIGNLVQKISVQDWITMYENAFLKKK